jgi:hypothetical protein
MQGRAEIEVARNTYALPARHKTIQIVGVQGITAAVVVYALWQLFAALTNALQYGPNAPVPSIAAAIVGVVAVLAVPTIIEKLLRR